MIWNAVPMGNVCKTLEAPPHNNKRRLYVGVKLEVSNKKDRSIFYFSLALYISIRKTIFMIKINTEITEEAHISLHKVKMSEKKRLKRNITLGQAITAMAKEFEQLKNKLHEKTV